MNMKKIFCVLFFLWVIVIDTNAQTMNITYTTITRNDPKLNYTVNATYPQVNFGPDALMGVRGNAEDINNSIDTMVNKIITDFANDVAQMPMKTVNGIGSSLGITSQASVVNSWLLTGQLTEFNNIAGMAHPMTTIHSFNYTSDGTGPILLSALFKPDSDYLNYISTVSIQQLSAYAEKEGYNNINDMIIKGAAADAKNFTQWNIKDDNLVLTFNPYQVAPYVFGIQTVSIPLSDLLNILDPKGPLSFMFR